MPVVRIAGDIALLRSDALGGAVTLLAFGVGTTSISNVFWKRYNKSLRSAIVARVQAGPRTILHRYRSAP
jgi:hypothetical protein